MRISKFPFDVVDTTFLIIANVEWSLGLQTDSTELTMGKRNQFSETRWTNK